jgi:hypothetical protein
VLLLGGGGDVPPPVPVPVPVSEPLLGAFCCPGQAASNKLKRMAPADAGHARDFSMSFLP